MSGPRPIIHLTAPASPCRGMLKDLGCGTAGELIDHVGTLIGRGYRVTGNAALIEAVEDDDRGGRTDDAARAADLQRALANNQVAGVVALRGGAWLTRILPRIDFDVLRRRTSRVAIFGFSELTTVVNIAARYPQAVCWYDLGPGFIPTGLARWARTRQAQPPADSGAPGARPSQAPGNAESRARQEFAEHLAAFFADVVARIEGRPSSRLVYGQLAAGRLSRESSVKIVGGTLSVVISLIGTPYARWIFRRGRWLAIEDVGEAPHRIDRMLAHLKLAGILERCGGLLIGDFHEGERDRVSQVLASLDRILPRRSRLPVVVSQSFGHTWPMGPLLIGRRVVLRRRATSHGAARVALVVPWGQLGVRPNKKRG